MSHHTGAEFITLSFHTMELMDKMRHPRFVQSINMQVPMCYAAPDQINKKWWGSDFDSRNDLHCICHGSGRPARRKPTKASTEKSELGGIPDMESWRTG